MTITHDNEPIKVEDSILVAVMTKYHERSKQGFLKYGTTLDRNDIDLNGWLNHLQDELMDATLYIEKLKKEQFRQSIKTQVDILQNVLDEMLVGFQSTEDRMNFILDICNGYKREIQKRIK